MSGGLLDSLFAQVRAEGANRAGNDFSDKASLVRAMLMPRQVELEADQSPRISVRSARRSGKSTAVIYITTIRCLEQAGARWIVICLTRTSAALRDYWTTLQVLNDSFELGIRFNKLELSATFKNGASVRFVGADNLAEIEKLRGSQYDGVIIDECKSFDAAVFEELVQDVLEPALMDRAGVLYVIGTPGDFLDGPFYLATSETPIQYKAPDGSTRVWNRPQGGDDTLPFYWSLHQWTLKDNTTVFRNKRTGEAYTLWDKALEVKARRGWTDDNETWRREYLGHWVASNNKFVYRYASYKHDHTFSGAGPFGLPGTAKEPWHRVVGIDLGTRDGTAFVVWAYSDTHPGLYELYSEKRTAESGQKFPVSAVADWYRDVEELYGPFEVSVCDFAGLATMVMDTLADDHGVYLEPAEKKQKNDFIVLFNTDLDNELIHYQPESQLALETSKNRWNTRKLTANGKRVEDDATPNDLCDAALYAFRWCNHRKARAPGPSGPAQGTEAWWQLIAANEMQAARAAAKDEHDQKTNPRLDANWWEGDN